MKETIKKGWSLFNKSQRKKTLILSGLIILNIFVETLGVGIIFPIITAILDPEKLLNYEIIKNSISYFAERGWFFDQNVTKSLNSSKVVIFGMILLLFFQSQKFPKVLAKKIIRTALEHAGFTPTFDFNHYSTYPV